MEIKKNTIFVIFCVFAIAGLGVWGYSVIEGWGFRDALYMTLITLTTTGFQEVHPLTADGRMFTMVLLVVGMGTVAYSASYLMQSLMSMDFNERRRKKMQSRIDKYKDHIILCGFGRMGKVVAHELHEQNVNFVIIENFPDGIKQLEESPYLWLEGDATLDETLIRAGVKRARIVASMVDSDADSLYITLAVKSLNPNLYIMTRANDESARQKIARAGANKVVLPITVSGIKVAQTLIDPAIEDLLDIDGVELTDQHRVQMAEIHIDFRSPLLGKSLSNCGLKKQGFMVVGIRHDDGGFSFAPDALYEFKRGDTLVSLTTPETQGELVKAQHTA